VITDLKRHSGFKLLDKHGSLFFFTLRSSSYGIKRFQTLTSTDCETLKKTTGSQKWRKMLDATGRVSIMLVHSFLHNGKECWHAFTVHKVDEEWVVFDSAETFAQILIEEDEKHLSDLEYCNFNYEFQKTTKINFYELVLERDLTSKWHRDGIEIALGD
jgi:hypothetical protein